MRYAHHPRRPDAPVVPSASGVVGGTTATSVQFTSSLLLGPSASPLPSVTNPLDPNDPLITLTDTTSLLTSPTSSSSAVSHPTSSPMSTGAVLGISAGVFVVAVAAMYAVYMHFKRRTYAQARQPLTRGSPPTSRFEGANRGSGGDKWQRLEGSDKPPAGEVNPTIRPKTPEIGKFALFEKDPSIRSVDEKASHTFDPAAMPNFTRSHPNLAEELSTVPPSQPFASGVDGSQVVSWGGDTVADSFLTLRTSGSMSPSAVVARQTPMTTDSAQHRWESAEVLIMGESVTERPSVYSDIAQNPFRDDDDDRASRSNPFFNASQHNPFSDQHSRSRSQSRKSSVSTVKRSRSNSVTTRGTVRAGAGDNALLSLIAALDSRPVAPEDQENRVSLQTMATSIYTPVESGAAPPTPKAF